MPFKPNPCLPKDTDVLLPETVDFRVAPGKEPLYPGAIPERTIHSTCVGPFVFVSGASSQFC